MRFEYYFLILIPFARRVNEHKFAYELFSTPAKVFAVDEAIAWRTAITFYDQIEPKVSAHLLPGIRQAR